MKAHLMGKGADFQSLVTISQFRVLISEFHQFTNEMKHLEYFTNPFMLKVTPKTISI